MPTVERPLRLAEFDRLFAESVVSWSRTSATRLELTVRRDAEAVARDLAVRESECCSFFSFEFHSAGVDVVTMGVCVPLSRMDVLDALAARIEAITRGDE